MKLFLSLIIALFVYAPSTLYASDLAIDLADRQIDITSGFDGAHLKLFGVQKQSGDIVITVTGPKRKTTVRKKEQIFAFWMNRRTIQFDKAPTYYAVASARPLNNMASSDILKEHKIGVESVRFTTDAALPPAELKAFQDAMIRNKKAQGLYSREPQSIEFIDDHFFRTQFYIPSNAPVGDYTIRTFLLDDGAIKAQAKNVIRVAQVGTSAAIHNFAHHWSVAYGVLCVIFALSAGWLSSIIRQKLR